uniref:Phospholipase n=1 Tax=Sorangium cellulosum TaxID=56 RepID=F1B9Q8_SORCE|nr:phospholipase [Sorangium cellulosum]
MSKYRVLSFDGTSGSGRLGYIGAGLLKEMHALAQQQGASMMKNVDVFAGTSGGAWNALFFAMHDDPEAALTDVLDFWQNVVDCMPAVDKQTVSIMRELRALTGGAAVVNTRRVRDFFIDYFGRNTKLGDLKQKVVIPAFKLDNRKARRRHWKVKIFNTMSPNEPDLDELVVDVAMRTSASPVISPIFQSIFYRGPGYIDGGVFANDPSMVALAQVHSDAVLGSGSGKEILLLSVGNGRRLQYIEPKFENGMADWGYRPWLLNLFQPFALVDLVMEANMMTTTYQCKRLLRDRYFRIDPDVTQSDGLSTQDVYAAVETEVAQQNTQNTVTRAFAWLQASGWLMPLCDGRGEAAPGAGAEGPGAAAPNGHHELGQVIG